MSANAYMSTSTRRSLDFLITIEMIRGNWCSVFTTSKTFLEKDNVLLKCGLFLLSFCFAFSPPMMEKIVSSMSAFIEGW